MRSRRTEAFKKFLGDLPFTILTDHRGLQFLFQDPSKAEHAHWSSKLIHWAEHLSAFDYTLKQTHLGLSNQFTYTLTHLSLHGIESALPELTKDITLKRIAAEGITLSKLQTATKDDSIPSRSFHLSMATGLYRHS